MINVESYFRCTKKIILRCVGFCFYLLHFICKVDKIAIDPTYIGRIIVPFDNKPLTHERTGGEGGLLP